MARKLQISHQLLFAEMAMVATVADTGPKSEDAPKAKTGVWLDLAMAMHLAAGRFSSPAGIVFLQHNYLPQLPRKGG